MKELEDAMKKLHAITEWLQEQPAEEWGDHHQQLFDVLEAAEVYSRSMGEMVSLRDEIAIRVMPSFTMSNSFADMILGQDHPLRDSSNYADWRMMAEARVRYRMADLMLKERKRDR